MRLCPALPLNSFVLLSTTFLIVSVFSSAPALSAGGTIDPPGSQKDTGSSVRTLNLGPSPSQESSQYPSQESVSRPRKRERVVEFDLDEGNDPQTQERSSKRQKLGDSQDVHGNSGLEQRSNSDLLDEIFIRYDRYCKDKRYGDAAGFLEPTLRLENELGFPRFSLADEARINRLMGQAYFKSGKFDQAIRSFTEALDLRVGQAECRKTQWVKAFLHCYRAKAYDGNSKYFRAEQDYNTALRLIGDQTKERMVILLNMGRSYIRSDQYAKAIEVFSSVKKNKHLLSEEAWTMTLVGLKDASEALAKSATMELEDGL